MRTGKQEGGGGDESGRTFLLCTDISSIGLDCHFCNVVVVVGSRSRVEKGNWDRFLLHKKLQEGGAMLKNILAKNGKGDGDQNR